MRRNLELYNYSTKEIYKALKHVCFSCGLYDYNDKDVIYIRRLKHRRKEKESSTVKYVWNLDPSFYKKIIFITHKIFLIGQQNDPLNSDLTIDDQLYKIITIIEDNVGILRQFNDYIKQLSPNLYAFEYFLNELYKLGLALQSFNHDHAEYSYHLIRFQYFLIVLKASVLLGLNLNIYSIEKLCTRFRLSLIQKDTYNWIWYQLTELTELSVESMWLNVYLLKYEELVTHNNQKKNQKDEMLGCLNHAIAQKYTYSHITPRKQFRFDNLELFDFLVSKWQVKLTDSFVNKDIADNRQITNIDTVAEKTAQDIVATDQQNDIQVNVSSKWQAYQHRHANFQLQSESIQLAYLFQQRQAFVLGTDVRILPPQIYQLLVNALKTSLLLETDISHKKIAAILLLSMVLGDRFHDDEDDFSENEGKYYIKSELCITDRLPNTERILLNQKKSISLPVSKQLVSVFLRKKAINTLELSEFVQKLKKQLKLVYLTQKRIQLAFSSVAHVLNKEELSIAYLINVEPNSLASMYYGGFDEERLIDDYHDVLQYLGLNDDYRSHQNSLFDNHIRVGSQVPPTYAFAQTAMANLRKHILRQSSFNKRINLYTLYMRLILMLCTGMRPINKSIIYMNNIDFNLRIMMVNDKDNRHTSNHRLLPICKFLKDELVTYLQALKLFETYTTPHNNLSYIKKIANSQQSLFHFFLIKKDGFTLSPTPPDYISDYLQQHFVVRKNWPRHLLKNFLLDNKCPSYLMNALYGHESHLHEAMNPASSIDNHYTTLLLPYLDEFVRKLKLKNITLKQITRKL